jgi:hypothetical protein
MTTDRGLRLLARLASPGMAAALAIFTLLCLAAFAPLASAARELSFGEFWSQVLVLLPLTAVGLVVARRQPRNPIGWIFQIMSAVFALGLTAGAYAVLAYRLGHHLPLAPVASLLALYWAAVIAAFPASIMLFPDGRLPSPRWRWVMGAYFVVAACWPVSVYAVAIGALASGDTRTVSGGDLRVVDFPAGSSAWLGTVETVVLPALGVFWLVFVARQVISWRSAGGERRQQLKWLMSGAAVTLAATAFIAIGSTLDTHASPLVQTLANIAILGIAALPVCMGVAILRYRLYDIDRIISRTLAYTIVTGLLVGVYAGLVLLATHILAFGSAVSVAAATLAAAALFNPLRRRVQRVVDRRFNRARYDADQTITAFSTRLQDAVDIGMVRDELVAVVAGSLEPEHVSVWLAGSDR